MQASAASTVSRYALLYAALADAQLQRTEMESKFISSSPTAQQIPPELIAQIALNIILVCAKGKDFLAPGDHKNRKYLGACALVCRYWAGHLRPIQFNFVALHGASDFHALLEMLSNPGPARPLLAECVHDIDIWQSGPWAIPWIHDLHRIRALTTHPLNFGIWVRHIEDYRLSRRCLEGNLPRTLPGSILTFERLFLEDIHLRNVRDLVRVVGYIPYLESVRCAKVTFEDSRIPHHRLLPRSRGTHKPNRIFVIEVQDSGGPRMEQELMLKILDEVYHRLGHTDQDIYSLATWQTFHRMILLLTLHNLIAAKATGECMSAESLCSSAYKIPRFVASDNLYVLKDASFGELALRGAPKGTTAFWNVNASQFSATFEGGCYAALESTLIELGTTLIINCEDAPTFQQMRDAVDNDRLFPRLRRLGWQLRWPASSPTSQREPGPLAVRVSCEATGKQIC